MDSKHAYYYPDVTSYIILRLGSETLYKKQSSTEDRLGTT